MITADGLRLTPGRARQAASAPPAPRPHSGGARGRHRGRRRTRPAAAEAAALIVMIADVCAQVVTTPERGAGFDAGPADKRSAPQQHREHDIGLHGRATRGSRFILAACRGTLLDARPRMAVARTTRGTRPPTLEPRSAAGGARRAARRGARRIGSGTRIGRPASSPAGPEPSPPVQPKAVPPHLADAAPPAAPAISSRAHRALIFALTELDPPPRIALATVRALRRAESGHAAGVEAALAAYRAAERVDGDRTAVLASLSPLERLATERLLAETRVAGGAHTDADAVIAPNCPAARPRIRTNHLAR